MKTILKASTHTAVKSNLSLTELGWQPFFQQQISLEELELLSPARVIEQHRSEIEIISEFGKVTLPVSPAMPGTTVGDWLLVDKNNHFIRVLGRNSSFSRKAAGSKLAEQAIAANVDTAFIVCSLNEDFNLNRIERFLSLVNESKAEPVVVLSKEDLCDEPDDYRQQVQKLDGLLSVLTVNGCNVQSCEQLKPWCKLGRTIVLLGSSGAGKSTLANTLLQQDVQAIGKIRDDDSKGKHTTTSRSLLPMQNGALLLDTPGMRELQLLACEEGVSTTFHEIESLANRCRFTDCRHGSEPDCAITKALVSGEIDDRRFKSYQKLLREQAMNSASLAERRASDKKLGRYYKDVISQSTKIKRGD